MHEAQNRDSANRIAQTLDDKGRFAQLEVALRVACVFGSTPFGDRNRSAKN